jgi:hypothetical protein
MPAVIIVIQVGMSTKLTLVVGDQKNISQQRYNRRSWQLQNETDRSEPPGEEVAGDT